MNVCMYCGKDENEREIYFRAVYHPFDDEPTTEGYICDYCSDDIEWCESCGREIYSSNGMRRNVRWDENEGMICVKCLHELWFVEGMERFKDGDFFDDSELFSNGFIKEPTKFLRLTREYNDLENRFVELKDSGNLVIVSIEASGMGFEHRVSLWYKKENI